MVQQPANMAGRIGLAISKSLVELMGGNCVEVNSGREAVFSSRLLCAWKTNEPEKALDVHLHGMKSLVVDDILLRFPFTGDILLYDASCGVRSLWEDASLVKKSTRSKRSISIWSYWIGICLE
jgi:hypothetical protein